MAPLAINTRKASSVASMNNDMTTEALRFLSQHPEIQAIDLLITDINGVIRGKRIEVDALDKVYSDGVFMPASLFSLDIRGITVEECGLGMDIGEPDKLCQAIPGSLKLSSWHHRPMAQLQMSMYEPDGQPFFADPRHILSRIVERFQQLKIQPVVAVELEFYLVDKERDIAGRLQPPLSPETGKRQQHGQVYAIDKLNSYEDFLEDVAHMAAEQGLPADTAVAENSPGQFEINLKHQADVLAACDNAIMLKRIIKAVAQKHGMQATFMAKPYGNEAGNGLHVHVSLVDAQGNNLFAATDAEFSDLLPYAVAGLLDTMPESMAIFCPNINSYRRMQPEHYAPVSATWVVDNRTVALRIPAGSAEARRIEHRVSGADANPYLVMAAILAGIDHGLRQQKMPIAATQGNAFTQDNAILPCQLRQALGLLAESQHLQHYLGQEFIKVYQTNKHFEMKSFEHYITPLEVDWYMNTL